MISDIKCLNLGVEAHKLKIPRIDYEKIKKERLASILVNIFHTQNRPVVTQDKKQTGLDLKTPVLSLPSLKMVKEWEEGSIQNLV